MCGSGKSKRLGDLMKNEAHLNTLKLKHEKLSKKIDFEQRRPAFNTLELSILKKQKLIIKQEISRVLENI
jgi:hypothetical protein